MSKKIKILYVVTTGLTLVTLALVAVPPLMAWWNKPMLVGGWPTGEIAVISLCVVMCIIMCVANVIENCINKKEKEQRKRGVKIEY
ncbi:MAG: hypothetical protein V8Q42_03210 [Anaerovoracaceae bacterium]